jgi:hypothetical protein
MPARDLSELNVHFFSATLTPCSRVAELDLGLHPPWQLQPAAGLHFKTAIFYKIIQASYPNPLIVT